MKENINTYQVIQAEIELANEIEVVGVVDGNYLGVRIDPTPFGGYDVAEYVYDNESQMWMAVGDAEEQNNFATPREARRRGIEVLLLEVQCFLK